MGRLSDEPSNRRQHLAVFVVLVPALLAGCGSEEPASPKEPGWQALESLSAFEREVLRDKTITRAEIDQATQVYVECLTRHEIEVEQPNPWSIGPGGIWTEFAAASDEEGDLKIREIDQCYAEVNAAQDVWRLQNELSEEDRQAALDEFPRCVRGAGLRVPEGTTIQESVRMAENAARAGAVGPIAIDVGAVEACLETLALKMETALPGLEDALNALQIE